jgi:hypothetical protein
VWARRILPAKNTLSAADACRVEDAFRTKLAELNDRAGEPEPVLRSPTSKGANTTVIDGGRGLDLIISNSNEVQIAARLTTSATYPRARVR